MNPNAARATLREQITVRLPADLKTKLQREADKRGASLNGLILEFLWKQLGEK